MLTFAQKLQLHSWLLSNWMSMLQVSSEISSVVCFLFCSNIRIPETFLFEHLLFEEFWYIFLLKGEGWWTGSTSNACYRSVFCSLPLPNHLTHLDRWVPQSVHIRAALRAVSGTVNKQYQSRTWSSGHIFSQTSNKWTKYPFQSEQMPLRNKL